MTELGAEYSSCAGVSAFFVYLCLGIRSWIIVRRRYGTGEASSGGLFDFCLACMDVVFFSPFRIGEDV